MQGISKGISKILPGDPYCIDGMIGLCTQEALASEEIMLLQETESIIERLKDIGIADVNL